MAVGRTLGRGAFTSVAGVALVVVWMLAASACSSSSSGEPEAASADPNDNNGSGDDVSMAQLQAAADATVRCMEDAGLSEVTADLLDDYTGVSTHGFSYALAEGNMEESPDAVECRETHYDPVSFAWQAANQAQLDAANNAYIGGVIACLEAKGIDVEGSGLRPDDTIPNPQAWHEENEVAYRACRDKADGLDASG